MTKKKPIALWVSMNDYDGVDCVTVWEHPEKPVLNPLKNGEGHIWEQGNFDCTAICTDVFKRVFGFLPKRGQCLKVKFSAKEVK